MPAGSVPGDLLAKAPWLARVPDFKKSHKKEQDQDADLERKAMLKCFVHLFENPGDSGPCLLWLEDRTARRADPAASSGGDDPDFFQKVPGKMSSVDIKFMASYWKEKGCKVPDGEMGKWRAKDPEGFRLAFCGWLNTGPGLKMDARSGNCVILRKAWDSCRASAGDRFPLMFVEGVHMPELGVPDWGRVSTSRLSVRSS